MSMYIQLPLDSNRLGNARHSVFYGKETIGGTPW